MTPTVYPGLFIVFEGGDGCGKTTQAKRLVDHLTHQGQRAIFTREPGDGALGARIRELILHHEGPIDARAEALLFAADRAQHVSQVIRPALEQGITVVCDRYIDSSIAYQCAGRGLDRDDIVSISKWASGGLVPDMTLVLDVDADTALSRRAHRGEVDDRMEHDMKERHAEIRSTFLMQANLDPSRYCVVDARSEMDEVSTAIFSIIDGLV